MKEQLALYGGPKVKKTPAFPMYPGGLEIGEEEKNKFLRFLIINISSDITDLQVCQAEMNQ